MPAILDDRTYSTSVPNLRTWGVWYYQAREKQTNNCWNRWKEWHQYGVVRCCKSSKLGKEKGVYRQEFLIPKWVSQELQYQRNNTSNGAKTRNSWGSLCGTVIASFHMVLDKLIQCTCLHDCITKLLQTDDSFCRSPNLHLYIISNNIQFVVFRLHLGIMGPTVCQANIHQNITPPPPLIWTVDTMQVGSID